MEIQRMPECKRDFIPEFQRLSGRDLSRCDLQDTPVENLITSSFDEATKWPASEKLPNDFNPKKLFEEGKNPGLGLRDLHSEGIDGRGVVVAIIDQKLFLNHSEYNKRIQSYTEYGNADKEGASMHGSAVASLLAGEKCGVAPGVDLTYKATSSGREFSNYAKALKDIVEGNRILNKEKRVRIVSCSIGYLEENPEVGLEEWIAMIQLATKEGIIVIDSSDRFINFIGGGSPYDRDDINKYRPWLSLKQRGISEGVQKKSILVPSDYRTFASSQKEKEFIYNGLGGISWSIPYLAGVCALVLQVNSNLKQQHIAHVIKESVLIGESGLKVINPKGAVELARKF